MQLDSFLTLKASMSCCLIRSCEMLNLDSFLHRENHSSPALSLRVNCCYLPLHHHACCFLICRVSQLGNALAQRKSVVQRRARESTLSLCSCFQIQRHLRFVGAVSSSQRMCALTHKTHINTFHPNNGIVLSFCHIITKTFPCVIKYHHILI